MPGTPPTSPRFGVARYADSDTASFSAQVNAITDGFDAGAAGYLKGTAAARPAASSANEGMVYRATDTGEWSWSNGTIWFEMGGLAPPVVTGALPGSPYDGQIIDYLADSTNGVVWRFRYRSASTSAHKWEFVGGPAVTAEDATSQNTSSTAYATLANDLAAFVLPGDYRVELGALVSCAATAYMSIATYSTNLASIITGAVDADSVQATNSNGVSASRVRQKVNLGSDGSNALLAQYKTSNAANPATFQYRFLAVRPIRVG